MYGLSQFYDDLDILRSQGARVFDIGRTVLGRNIPCVFKGSTEGAQVLVQATIHAREYIVTPVVMRLMREYTGKGGIWCVPMVNIDGAMLCQFGLDSLGSEERKRFLLRVNGGSTDFALWKANINAVDLNTNFPADWGTGALNVFEPSPANYVGEYPLSQPESDALARLSMRVQPKITLSYHTKGNIIYWAYRCNNFHREQAARISELTGYPLLESGNSAGGFKDWFDATTPYLGLTMECGNELLNYPLPMAEAENIYERNRGILELASSLAEEI